MLELNRYTVNQARSIIRQNPSQAERFLKHKNRNVVNTAQHAIRFKLPNFNRVAPILAQGLSQSQVISTLPTPFSVTSAGPNLEEIRALAEKYEETEEFVRTMVAEKGSLAAAKRSLAARLGAKKKALAAKAS